MDLLNVKVRGHVIYREFDRAAVVMGGLFAQAPHYYILPAIDEWEEAFRIA